MTVILSLIPCIVATFACVFFKLGPTVSFLAGMFLNPMLIYLIIKEILND